MAAKLPIKYTTLRKLYAHIDNTSGEKFNKTTSLFETPANTPANYNVNLNESTLPYQYYLTWPTGIPIGFYFIAVYENVSGVLTTPSQANDKQVGGGDYYYNGADILIPATATDVANVTVYGSAGPVNFEYTERDEDNVTPLPNVAIFVTADQAGTHPSETKVTDSLGRVRFSLYTGDVWLWRTRFDKLFADNPIQRTVV